MIELSGHVSMSLQLFIGFYAMSVAIGVCKYKLISSCIIDRWLINAQVHTCDLYILFCYSHPLPSQCLHQSIISNTTATAFMPDCGHFWQLWPALVPCLPPAALLPSCIMCFCQAELFHCVLTIEFWSQNISQMSFTRVCA